MARAICSLGLHYSNFFVEIKDLGAAGPKSLRLARCAPFFSLACF